MFKFHLYCARSVIVLDIQELNFSLMPISTSACTTFAKKESHNSFIQKCQISANYGYKLKGKVTIKDLYILSNLSQE